MMTTLIGLRRIGKTFLLLKGVQGLCSAVFGALCSAVFGAVFNEPRFEAFNEPSLCAMFAIILPVASWLSLYCNYSL